MERSCELKTNGHLQQLDPALLVFLHRLKLDRLAVLLPETPDQVHRTASQRGRTTARRFGGSDGRGATCSGPILILSTRSNAVSSWADCDRNSGARQRSQNGERTRAVGTVKTKRTRRRNETAEKRNGRE